MIPGHEIKPLLRTAIPRRHLFLSARSRLTGGRYGWSEEWRCAQVRAWTASAAGREAGYVRNFDTDSTLWATVTDFAKASGVTFLWVYDLSWTGRITGMFDLLPRLGWQLDALSLNPGAPWLVWKRRGATLKVVDMLSIWPHSLDRIGQFFGMARKDKPDEEGAFLQWISACSRDVDIMEMAAWAYMDWIVADNLGSLAVTGNSQAWTAFRRRFMTHGILVHEDKELREAERRAMWTGRCEAYWHGALLRQVVDEWDFSSAHTHIARHEAVPVFPIEAVDATQPIETHLGNAGRILLAEVDINADRPIVPTLLDGGIVWPTGVFTTTLWEPELRRAQDAGHIVRMRRGWHYRSAPALRDWARWLLANLTGPDSDCPAWKKDILKRWGNVLIGRFGMRYPKWEKLGVSTAIDCYCVPCMDADGGEETLLMQVGHQLWQQIGMTEPNNSAPAITGYVMSAMRAKLWDLIETMPADALLYVDTDSILTTDAWRRYMEARSSDPRFDGLRLKRSWDGFAIYGPRQLVTGTEVRMAGIPKNAQRTERHTFVGETIESIPTAFAARVVNAVRITPRQWTVEGVDNRRVGHRVGWTEPVHIEAERIP